jgi:hypothetical protein
LSVASSAAAASSANDASASRALPWTLSSMRLNTTFGIAHQTSANAAPSSLSRIDGSVSHTLQIIAPEQRTMMVLTSTAGGWRTAQINHPASGLKASKSPSGGRAGWTPAAERVCAHEP